MKFKLNDRVNHNDFGNGTIIGIEKYMDAYLPYIVEFDNEHPVLHDGDRAILIGEGINVGKNNHCWWCEDIDLELLEDNEVEDIDTSDAVRYIEPTITLSKEDITISIENKLDKEAIVRSFSSGAIRDTNVDKYNYEGFNSPLVMEAEAKYMHKNRFLKDGTVRDADNWQKGFGATLEEHQQVCMESLFRHFMDLWLIHRGYPAREGIDDAICGILFNTRAIYHAILKDRLDNNEQ